MQHHGLKIDNYENNQTVQHSLIILKGHIDTTNCQKNNASNSTISVSLQTPNTNLITQLSTTDNKFKFILQLLDLKENVITITYCCETFSIKLTHCPRKTLRSIIPLYIICEGHDGRFQAPQTEDNSIESALKRIDLCCKLLQCVISEKFYEESNLERKSFCIEDNCQIFRSNLNYLEARKLSQEKLWERLGKEILNSCVSGNLDKKYLAFLSCTRYCTEKYSEKLETYEDFVGITEAYVALGGGGLALFGTACLYTWPENVSEIISRFEDVNLIDKKKFMDDSCYRGSLGACFSTTLGSVLHELCHTFDLGHTKNGIMGRGFDNIHKIFTTNTKAVQQNNPSNLLKTFQTSIEFQEDLTQTSSTDGFKNFKHILTAPIRDEDDDTFWTKHCLILLYYHKWFNDYKNKNPSFILKYDKANRIISSTNGIRVIEIREVTNELVLNSWIFDGRILKYSFQIPEGEFFGQSTSEDAHLQLLLLFVVVEDNLGNLLKDKY